VVSDIILGFTEDMEVSASVYLSRMVGNDENKDLKTKIGEIFRVKTDNIHINGGKYE